MWRPEQTPHVGGCSKIKTHLCLLHRHDETTPYRDVTHWLLHTEELPLYCSGTQGCIAMRRALGTPAAHVSPTHAKVRLTQHTSKRSRTTTIYSRFFPFSNLSMSHELLRSQYLRRHNGCPRLMSYRLHVTIIV